MFTYPLKNISFFFKKKLYLCIFVSKQRDFINWLHCLNGFLNVND